MGIMNWYPKARQNRVHGHDPSVMPARIGLLKAAFTNFTLLQILFLGLFSYIFGALFQQDSHVHNMNILYVDYDGGIIGSSVRDAYSKLQGHGFPTVLERPAAQFQTPKDLKNEVCNTNYWAALYTSPGATTRLEAALAGGPAAASYNRSDVLTYIWNEAVYSAIVDSTIQGSIQKISSNARVEYSVANGTGALQSMSLTDQSAISVFANPWQLSDVNIQPTSQGSRLIYNTLVIILILIQEFFYLGTINGLYVQFKIYTRLYAHRIIIYRNMISLAYTLVGSLCVTGAIWAFRAGWEVNGNQFALSWAILWLFAHANFLSLDVFSVWLPVQFVPMALITWVVLNVTSILIPFELSPAFYRWSYAMPAHEVYLVLTDIWSRGCNPKLHYALPVLFSLEIVGLALSALGVIRRCHFAVLAEEAQEKAFRDRVDVAVAFQKERDEEKRATPQPVDPEIVEEIDREKLGEIIQKEDDELRREQTKASRAVGFGPSFDLAFHSDS